MSLINVVSLKAFVRARRIENSHWGSREPLSRLTGL